MIMKTQKLYCLLPLMVGFLLIALMNACASQPERNTVSDIDGNVYKTVIIGDQEWFAENLKTTRYNDGTAIPHVTDNRQWSSLSSGAYCWYDNDPGNDTIYGALYNWHAVNTGKLCPQGWRVPTDNDWKVLMQHVSGNAAGRLKATGTLEAGDGLWKHPNVEATNETGFSALPGGFRWADGSFSYLGDNGNWWSSSEHSLRYAGAWFMHNNYSRVSHNNEYKNDGFSVRCIRAVNENLDKNRQMETTGIQGNAISLSDDAWLIYSKAVDYLNEDDLESALNFAMQVHEMEPYYFGNLRVLMNILERKGRVDEVSNYIDGYLENQKLTLHAWLHATHFYNRIGEIEKAWELIQEARQHFRRDSQIEQQFNFLYHRRFIEPNLPLFNEAIALYNNDNFEAAIEKFDEYIELVDRDPNGFRMRAFSHYRIGQFIESIEDIEHFFAIHEKDAPLLNLRGVCLRELGDLEAACRDFEEAMRLGNTSGRTNYNNFCRNN